MNSHKRKVSPPLPPLHIHERDSRCEGVGEFNHLVTTSCNLSLRVWCHATSFTERLHVQRFQQDGMLVQVCELPADTNVASLTLSSVKFTNRQHHHHRLRPVSLKIYRVDLLPQPYSPSLLHMGRRLGVSGGCESCVPDPGRILEFHLFILSSLLPNPLSSASPPHVLLLYMVSRSTRGLNPTVSITVSVSSHTISIAHRHLDSCFSIPATKAAITTTDATTIAIISTAISAYTVFAAVVTFCEMLKGQRTRLHA